MRSYSLDKISPRSISTAKLKGPPYFWREKKLTEQNFYDRHYYYYYCTKRAFVHAIILFFRSIYVSGEFEEKILIGFLYMSKELGYVTRVWTGELPYYSMRNRRKKCTEKKSKPNLN